MKVIITNKEGKYFGGFSWHHPGENPRATMQDLHKVCHELCPFTVHQLEIKLEI